MKRLFSIFVLLLVSAGLISISYAQGERNYPIKATRVDRNFEIYDTPGGVPVKAINPYYYVQEDYLSVDYGKIEKQYPASRIRHKHKAFHMCTAERIDNKRWFIKDCTVTSSYSANEGADIDADITLLNPEVLEYDQWYTLVDKKTKKTYRAIRKQGHTSPFIFANK